MIRFQRKSSILIMCFPKIDIRHYEIMFHRYLKCVEIVIYSFSKLKINILKNDLTF